MARSASASVLSPAARSPRAAEAWYSRDVEEVAAALGTSSRTGLSAEEAARRLAQHGPNELATARTVPPWRLLLEQFRNVLILILFAAVGLSVVLGHATEAIVIAAIVLLAVLLAFVQEYRAERAIEALGGTAAVDGDVDLPLGDRTNMVYSGTSATYGRGRAVVVATGMQTEFGGIARMLETIERGKTPLQLSLDRVAMVLARAALVVVLLVVSPGLPRGQPFLEMLLFGVALAVAVVPGALPAVITISLTLAAQRLVRRNALVRRLPAIETLGSVDVICSDKTGTLTKDELTVRKVLAGGELFDVSGAGYEPVGEFSRDGAAVEPSAAVVEALRAAVLASDARLVRGDEGQWFLRGDPTEGALVVAAAKAGLERAELEQRFPRVDEIPFTSESKRMTTLHETPDGTVAYAKGAPEVLLRSCRLEPEERRALLATAQELAGEAPRVLAVARRSNATPANAERDLTFLGLVAMIDPPRPEARQAVERCVAAGGTPVMIPGDNPLTAQAIARELGILTHGRAVTGAKLEAMEDTDLEREVDRIQVYARVSPLHKLRVVEALQRRGHTVAMTGDGVNDAPALKKADIGVAMGVTGTDVAK